MIFAICLFCFAMGGLVNALFYHKNISDTVNKLKKLNEEQAGRINSATVILDEATQHLANAKLNFTESQEILDKARKV